MQGSGQPASTDVGSINYFSISGNQYGVSSILADKFKVEISYWSRMSLLHTYPSDSKSIHYKDTHVSVFIAA